MLRLYPGFENEKSKYAGLRLFVFCRIRTISPASALYTAGKPAFPYRRVNVPSPAFPFQTG